MSNSFIDRDGDHWTKNCNLCDRLESYAKRRDDKTTCLAYGKSIMQEPVKSYYNAPEGRNECSKFYTTGQ